MIPGTLNSETRISEVKTIQVKKFANNNLTSVKYSELPRQEVTKKFADSNVEIIKVINGDTTITNLQEWRKLLAVNNVYNVEIEDKYSKKGNGKKESSKKLSSKKLSSKKGSSSSKRSKKSGPDIPIIQNLDQVPAKIATNQLSNLFLVRVFGLTFFLNVITAVFVAMVYRSENLREFLLDTTVGKMVVLSAAGGMVLLNCKIMCSPCMRVFPCNFISLIIAVIFMSLVAAYVTAIHNTTLVIYAFIGTAITVLVCYFLALTSFDFTKFVLYIFVVAVTFIALSSVVFAGVVITRTRFTLLELVFLFIGTIINILVLITELQLILGGRAVALNEDEYALGAFYLYTSIVDMFLKILQIFSITMDEDLDDLV